MPLRPQGLVEVVDRATNLLRTRLGDFATISLIVQVPLWLVLAPAVRDEWASGIEDNLAFSWLAFVSDPVILGLLADRAGDGDTLGILGSRLLASFGLAVIGAACGPTPKGVELGTDRAGRSTGVSHHLRRVRPWMTSPSPTPPSS